jgi:hypothetical protein
MSRKISDENSRLLKRWLLLRERVRVGDSKGSERPCDRLGAQHLQAATTQPLVVTLSETPQSVTPGRRRIAQSAPLGEGLILRSRIFPVWTQPRR